MHIFHNRPLALACCIFALSAVLMREIDALYKLLLILFSLILALLAGLFCLLRPAHRTYLFVLFCVGGVFLASLSSFLFFNVRYVSLQERCGDACEVSGVVSERISSLPYQSLLEVEVTEMDGKPIKTRAVVEFPYASALQVGESFRMTATPRSFSAEEQFDEENYRLADGCTLVLVCDSPEDCEKTGRSNDFKTLARKLNMRLSYRLYQDVGGEAGGVAAALLLGNRSFLSDETSLDFRRTGVSHLLALSGLHVSILIGFFEFLARLLRLSKLLRAFLIPISATLYLILTGCAVSTQRAVLLVCTLYLGYLLGSRYDSFTALCAALVLILLITPYAVMDLSLWMSFLSAGSIIIFSPAVSVLLYRLRRRLPRWAFRILSPVIGSLAIGFFASCSLLLLSAFVFGETSLLSIPTTMLLTLPVTVLLILSFAQICFPFLTPLTVLTRLVSNLILYLTAYLSDWNDILLPTGDIYTKSALAAMTAMMIWLAIVKWKRSRVLLLLVPMLLLSIAVSLCVTHVPIREHPYMQPIRTGHGEVRLYCKYGEGVLINDTRGAASGAYEIRVAALAARCSEINDVVISRYYNQATYFISSVSGTVKLRNLHLPMPLDARERAIAARLEDEAALHGIEVHYDAELWIAAYEG